MYRIYTYCFSRDNKEPKLKMYWNKRLNSWEFNKPTLVTFLEAYWFVINKYSCNEHKEVVYGIEEVL